MSIVWQRLSLSGFGRFQGTVTVDLEPRLNVIVADNEQGKSTLLAGLTAVLFGLPGVSDPEIFGQGKFKNWHGSLQFEGELHFAKDDTVYRIRRNFATHAITVSVRTDEGWSDQVVGEHNPRAHRRNMQYENFLKDAIGIINRELFWNVFAFGSPLPEASELDENIQQLLSGAGSAHYTDALKRLDEAGRRLTKFSKAMGISTRDRVNDGELEEVRARLHSLAEQLQASRAAVDEQQELQQKLNERQQERQAAVDELKETEAALQAWTTWRDVRSRHRRALAEQRQAVQAWEQYNTLARQVAAEDLRLRSEYAELQVAGEAVGEKLERLRDEAAKVEAALTRLQAETEATVKRGSEKLAAWQTFVRRRDELRNMDKRLQERFGVFERADEATRAVYARYEYRRDALEGKVESSRVAVARAREEAARRVREQARFDEMYGDLAALDIEAAQGAIAERLELLQRADELQAERAAVHDKRVTDHWHTYVLQPGIVVGVAAAAALAYGAFLFGSWTAAWPTFVVALGAATVLTVTLTRRARARAALQRLDEQLEQLQSQLGPDGRLGAFAGASLHELGVLSHRLAARREAAAALEDDTKTYGRPSVDEALAIAAEELAQAEAALQAFTEQVGPGVERFGDDVAHAYREWTSTRDDRERLEAELHRWVKARFGQKTLQPEEFDLLGMSATEGATGPAAVWSALAQTAVKTETGQRRLEAGGRLTVGQLVDLLPKWADDGAAAVVEQVSAALAASKPALHEPVQQLREQLKTVLAPVDGDVSAALARWQRYRTDQIQISDLKAQQSGILRGHAVDKPDALHERALDAGNRAATAREQLEQLSEQHAALPDPDEIDEGDAVAARLDALRHEAATLRERKESAEESSRQLLNRQAVLSGASVINIAGGELELDALKGREKQLQFEIDAISIAYRELVAAAEEYEQTHRDVLADGASKYIQQFTGRARRIVFDEQFRIEVQDPDGPVHTVAQLSQGTRDQLYLAIRLAIADIVVEEAPLPLLLDDPFVHCDAERLERIRAALHALQGERQVVLLSHRKDFESWGHAVQPEGEGWDGR